MIPEPKFKRGDVVRTVVFPDVLFGTVKTVHWSPAYATYFYSVYDETGANKMPFLELEDELERKE